MRIMRTLFVYRYIRKWLDYFFKNHSLIKKRKKKKLFPFRAKKNLNHINANNYNRKKIKIILTNYSKNKIRNKK